MPHYDYTCSACNHEMEAFQSIVAEPLKLCPQCNQETLCRGIGGGGSLFQFKGEGFYLTDYCGSKEKPVSSPKGCGCSGPHTCG